MTNKEKSSEGFWTKLGVLATILSLVITYLSYTKDNVKEYDTTTTGSSSVTTEVKVKARTNINIMYSGDYYGCVLPITIKIGDQTITPKGSTVSIPDVLVGTQDYQIEGQVQCQALGSCVVSGNGQLNIQPNRTFYVKWQNIGVGSCKIWLSESQ